MKNPQRVSKNPNTRSIDTQKDRISANKSDKVSGVDEAARRGGELAVVKTTKALKKQSKPVKHPQPSKPVKPLKQGAASKPSKQTKKQKITVSSANASVAAHKDRKRRRFVAALLWILGILSVIFALLIAGWFYLDHLDQEAGAYVPRGVTMNSVSLGGMTEAEVTKVVEDIITSHMGTKITVFIADSAIVMDMDGYVTSDPETLVKEIMQVRLDADREQRMRHDYLDTPIVAAFETGYFIDSEAIQRFAEDLATAHTVYSTNATLDYDGYTPVITDGADGYTFDAQKTAELIEEAMLSNLNDNPVSQVMAVQVPLVAEVSRADLTVPILTASISARQVMLWNGDELVKTYPCAVGQKKYPTIPGQYYIGLKEENPTWYNPDPEGWGKDAPKMIPGPNDALGVRGLHIYTLQGYNTMMLFHGALAADKAGTATTHGCLRMFNDDVIDLYDRVPVGTSVMLVK